MSERDEFEAWADAHSIYGGDKYVAWLAWKAARAPQAVPALTDEQILLGVAEFADENMLANHRPDILRCVRSLLAAAPQPSPEPGIPDGSIGMEGLQHNALLRQMHAKAIASGAAKEHAHDWRFSLQDHVYKCDCGATRGDYPFGAASFKD